MGNYRDWLVAGEMADALKRVNGEVYATANPHKEALEAFGQEKGIEHLYTDPDEMIKDPNLDIVYIATPHNFHYQYAKQALLAGKHVFCEKASRLMKSSWKTWQAWLKKRI